MRLPWYQIDADGITRGKMLGRLLGVGAPAGVGMAIELWRWALEMAEEGDFSGAGHDIESIAAALDWDPRNCVQLAAELQRVGFIECVPVVRIRGLERYRRTWEKNSRRPKPAPLAPVTGTTRAGLAPEPARKTETETETDKREAKSLVEQARPVREVFEHWQRVMTKPRALLDDKRARVVKARLAEGRTVEDLKLAIDGCRNTPHNMGSNDRGEKYNDLELICRDGPRVERFMANATAPPVPLAGRGPVSISRMNYEPGSPDNAF